MKTTVPRIGHRRLNDLFSIQTSPETKANTARWYGELFIDKFLSCEIKKELGSEEFERKQLGEKIKLLEKSYSKNIINKLKLIKSIGDKYSHYNPSLQINEKEIVRVQNAVLTLFNEILIDYFKKNRFDKTPYTAKILVCCILMFAGMFYHTLLTRYLEIQNMNFYCFINIYWYL